ncbi:protein of unknown function DUF1568 [Desulfuromonas acetoxidans DSM 684]|uniref:Transposase IS200-like domain-containing protein n=1 Tax=Desulfuromonas acetoxidans (strain DSM 684 / 11070) TaxID=281689 RepID=Q1K0A6_DESA6|nr:transposase [Desulfuromonas acetoxidans]EAT16035.1 protein of unknown function DUF1568 [Desulfuromonas acetoxidans DSM 684]
MPRHARIDIPGLLQHVIVRGIERRDIFITDDDREDFVRRLSGLLEETSTACYAWALLDNHVHLLLIPTEISLSILMRRLLTGYAVSFNLRHKRAGHLFQNRYKSIVCDSDVYLLELVRYIHLNPVRAGKVTDMNALADYHWSGHRQILGRKELCLVKDEDVLSLFSGKKSVARKAYYQFLADGLLQKVSPLSMGGRRVSQSLDDSLTDEDSYDDRILGGGSFVERVLGEEKPVEASRSFDELKKVVVGYFELDVTELVLPNKARRVSTAKAVLCYVAIRHYRMTGYAVGKALCYTPSAVSRAVQRGQKVFDGDARLRDILS